MGINPTYPQELTNETIYAKGKTIYIQARNRISTYSARPGGDPRIRENKSMNLAKKLENTFRTP